MYESLSYNFGLFYVWLNCLFLAQTDLLRRIRRKNIRWIRCDAFLKPEIFFRYYPFNPITYFLCNFLIIKLAFRHCNFDLVWPLLTTDLRQNQHWNLFSVECAEQKNASTTPTSWRSNPKRPAVSRRPCESVQSKTIRGKT